MTLPWSAAPLCALTIAAKATAVAARNKSLFMMNYPIATRMKDEISDKLCILANVLRFQETDQ